MRCFTTSVGTRTREAAHPASAADAKNAVCGLYSAERARFAGSYTAMKIAVAGATPSRLPLHRRAAAALATVLVYTIGGWDGAPVLWYGGLRPVTQTWVVLPRWLRVGVRAVPAAGACVWSSCVCGGIAAPNQCATKQVDGGMHGHGEGVRQLVSRRWRRCSVRLSRARGRVCGGWVCQGIVRPV